jgi:hypothetical protein
MSAPAIAQLKRQMRWIFGSAEPNGFRLPESGNTGVNVKWCAVLTLACIALIEIVFGRTGLVSRVLPEGDLGILFSLEDQVISRSVGPRTLIFGTSRARGAFLPTEMEGKMGLRRGQVLNLAIGGAQIIDPLITYEKNRSRLTPVSSVIIQLDPFEFSTGVGPGTRYRFFASWQDLMAYHGRKRAGVIEDYFFRTNSALPSVSTYLKTLLKVGKPPGLPGVDPFGRLAVVKISDEHNPRDFTDQRFRSVIDGYYSDFQYSPAMEDQLARLIRMAKQDGAHVLLVHMPTADGFRKLLAELPGNPDQQVRTQITRLAHNYQAEMVWWESPAEIGLTERDFRDWGHLSTAGARKFSEFFAYWMRSEGLLSAITVSSVTGNHPN